MGAYLSLSISESSLDKEANTSKVKATLYCHSNSGSWNGSSRSGYIEIDGSKHNFSSSFKSNTTTTLSSYTKTVKHDSDGGGKITIKGYYSTGVSAGNISTSKSYSLKKIDRTYAVKYDPNGGSGDPNDQTKTYGKTLTLSSTKPTRTGYNFVNWNTKKDGSGTSYSPGGSYTKNEAVTLYAQWKEIEYKIYFETEFTDCPDPITVTYTDRTKKWPTATAIGWHTTYWQTPYGAVLPGNIINISDGYAARWDGKTFPSIEEQWTSTVHFVYNNTVYGTRYYHYKDNPIDVPTPEVLGIELPEDKDWVGWNYKADFTGSLLDKNKKYWWNGAQNGNSEGNVYLQLKDKDDINIYYDEIWDIDGDDIDVDPFYGRTVKYGDSLEVEDLSSELKEEINGFKFAGYWRIGKLPEFGEWETYDLPNKYLFPYNFEPTFDSNHYNSTYDLVEPGYIIENITGDMELFPVYKDTSGSDIKLSNVYKDYVNKEDYNNTSVKNKYLAYLTGQSSEFDIVLLGEYYVVAWKIQLTSENIEINTNNLKCEVFDKNTGTLFDTFVSTEFLVSKYTDASGNRFVYLVISNVDPDPQENPHEKVVVTNSYILKLSGIVDTSGKEVAIKDTTLSPPNIVRDINSSGTVVAYFTGAPENPQYGGEKEFWIDGDLVITGTIHTSGNSSGGDDDAPFSVNKLQANSVSTNTISLSNLTDEENLEIFGDGEDSMGQLQMTYEQLNAIGYGGGDGEGMGGGDPGEDWDTYYDSDGKLKLDKYVSWLGRATTQYKELYGMIAELTPGGGGSEIDGDLSEVVEAIVNALTGWDETSEGEYVEHVGVGSAIAYALGTIIENILPRLDALDHQDSSDIISEIEPIYEDFETGYWVPGGDSGGGDDRYDNEFYGTITAKGSNYVTVKGYDDLGSLRTITFSGITIDLSGFYIDDEVYVRYNGSLDDPEFVDIELDEPDDDDDD